MNTDKSDARILAVAGKGGVGKTSLAAVMVKLLVAAYPDKRILAIDADPAVGLSTALGVDVKLTVDDIRKEDVYKRQILHTAVHHRTSVRCYDTVHKIVTAFNGSF